jgi:hypothetical protein
VTISGGVYDYFYNSKELGLVRTEVFFMA